MDIVDCILADHDRQRRWFAALDEARDDLESAGKIFNRLRDHLEAHAMAEETYFYTLLKLGKGALDSSADETTEDAIDDHNKITNAADAALNEKVGSDAWWECVDKANPEHAHLSKRNARVLPVPPPRTAGRADQAGHQISLSKPRTSPMWSGRKRIPTPISRPIRGKAQGNPSAAPSLSLVD